jgi:hypothetical protein
MVILNMSDEDAEIAGGSGFGGGRIVMSTDRRRRNEVVEGALKLPALSGVIIFSG